MGNDDKLRIGVAGLVSAAALVMLGGCDAGDSGDGEISYTGPTDAVSLSDSAAVETVAQAASYYVVDDPMNLSLENSVRLFVKVGGRAAGGATVTDFVRQWVLRAVGSQDAGGPSLAGVSRTEACGAGGTGTVDAVMADQTKLTVGDYFGIRVDGCAESSNGVTWEMDGEATVTVTSVSGDPYGNAGTWTLGLRTAFDGLRHSSTYSVDGESTTNTTEYGGALTETVSVKDWTYTSLGTVGSRLVIRWSNGDDAPEQRLSDFSFQRVFDDVAHEATSDSDFTVASTGLGGSLTVEMTTPFRWSPAYSLNDVDGSPDDGVMVITAGSARVKVAIETYGYVEVYEDLDGDGTWEGHTQYPASDFFY